MFVLSLKNSSLFTKVVYEGPELGVAGKRGVKPDCSLFQPVFFHSSLLLDNDFLCLTHHGSAREEINACIIIQHGLTKELTPQHLSDGN